MIARPTVKMALAYSGIRLCFGSHMNCIHAVSPFGLTTVWNLQFVSNLGCGEISCIIFGVRF